MKVLDQFPVLEYFNVLMGCFSSKIIKANSVMQNIVS